MKIPKWTRWLPNIAIFITLPLVSVRTAFFYESVETTIVEWTRIEIRVWKYEFAFKLFKRLP